MVIHLLEFRVTFTSSKCNTFSFPRYCRKHESKCQYIYVPRLFSFCGFRWNFNRGHDLPRGSSAAYESINIKWNAGLMGVAWLRPAVYPRSWKRQMYRIGVQIGDVACNRVFRMLRLKEFLCGYRVRISFARILVQMRSRAYGGKAITPVYDATRNGKSRIVFT